MYQSPGIRAQFLWPDGQQPEERFQRVHAVRFTFPIKTWYADIKTNRSFDLCDLTGAPQKFFPSGHLAMRGTYQEVSCTLWQGSDGTPLWSGSCMADPNAAFWPTPACGNQGMKRLPTCNNVILINVHAKDPHPVD